jgi:ketosteroid isomerase-like protein
MQTISEAQFTAQDEAALRGMFDAAIRYIKADDWASWARQYDDDGLLQPPHAPVVRGRAELQEWGQAFPEIEDLSFSNVKVSGEGNLAYGTSSYTLKLKGQAPDTGKQLVVFRRKPDGSWKLVAANFNSDLPVPGTSAVS